MFCPAITTIKMMIILLRQILAENKNSIIGVKKRVLFKESFLKKELTK